MQEQPSPMTPVEAIIIGGSQAGLAMSYWLKQHDISHVILEQGRLAENWRSQRWDSFVTVTPNYSIRLPGFPYAGDDPDGYMPRDELVAHLENYAAAINAPLRCGVKAHALRRHEHGAGFVVETADEKLLAASVVVATGALQLPHIPQDLSRGIPKHIVQVHTSQYRNPAQLPDGPVLVVGSGQSGCQIAEELSLSGRQVYLSVGKTGRIPRRYRGKDVYFWVAQAKLLTSTPGKFSNHAHVSGAGGGREINLYRFAEKGMILLGRVQGCTGSALQIAPDLLENLAYGDAFEQDYLRQVDEYVENSGYDAPLQPGDRPRQAFQYQGEILTTLDLEQSNIHSVIWATGYRYTFDWIDIPIFDATGFPLQERGITAIPGLYFVGINWDALPRSAFIGAVGSEAEHIANHLVEYRKTSNAT